MNARVDADKRARTVRNHSATHLMHKALREVLGAHVQQKGSLVDAERTRFDFAHNAPMTDEQIRKVEALVNAEILANAATQARVMPIDEAQKLGAMMLFGEKYGDDVRVLDIGSSRELCGGTHVQRTGDIGLFKIVAEGGVAAGVRRVEAVTGDNALAYLQQLESTVSRLAGTLKVTPAEVQGRVGAVLDQVRALEKELAALKGKLASSQGDELLAQAVDVKGMKVLAATLHGADAKTLRETMDKLKDKLKTRGHRAGGGRRRQGAARRRRHRRQHRHASRPASWSTSSPSRSAARAAASPTWRWPAAPMRPSCRRRWRRCRPGWPNACSVPLDRPCALSSRSAMMARCKPGSLMADIQIRRVRTSDAEGMARLMGDPATLGNLLQLPYPSVEAWRTRLAEWDQPGRADLLLVAEADGSLVGNAGLNPVGTALRRRHAMGLGITVAQEWQGRGVGTQLMTALLDAADRWLGVLRIELTVYTDNARRSRCTASSASRSRARTAPTRCATVATWMCWRWRACTPTRRASTRDAPSADGAGTKARPIARSTPAAAGPWTIAYIAPSSFGACMSVLPSIHRRCVMLAALAVAAGARAHQVRPWTQPVPPLALKDLDGKTWELSALQGRAVLLNFWATWCDPCREEMPSLQALAQRHEGEGLLVLMVNYRESAGSIKRFLERVPLSMPVLLDSDGAAARAWTSRVFPTTVMIDRSGRPRHQVVGAVDWHGDEARQWLRDLLAGAAART